MKTSADILITGGSIPDLSLASGAPANEHKKASTVAIRGNKILAVGGSELHSLATASTKIIDADGGAILPGINDGHLHFVASATTRYLYVGLDSCPSWHHAFEVLAQSAPGQDGWIRAAGWDEAVLGTIPQEDMGTILPNQPVVAFDQTGHQLFVNQAGLLKLGITADTPDVDGGRIARHSDGTPSGLFVDGAMQVVCERLPTLERAELRSALVKHQHDLHALGITSYTDPGLGPGGVGLLGATCGTDGFESLMSLAEDASLTLRATVLLLFNGTGGANAQDTRAGLEAGLQCSARDQGIDPLKLNIAGVKVFADGIPRSGTAWMQEPYGIQCAHGCGHLAVRGSTDEERAHELDEILKVIHEFGLQAGIHATGDRTSQQVIQTIAELEKTDPRRLRHYLIHGAFSSQQVLQSLVSAGMGYSTNPAIRASAGELMRTILGADRFDVQQPLSTALGLGAMPNIASDAPVTSPDWRNSVIAAVTRDTTAGPGHEDPERISLPQAIGLMTTAPAWQDGVEHTKGQLVPGQLADICVLESALPDDARELKEINTKVTIADGAIVFAE